MQKTCGVGMRRVVSRSMQVGDACIQCIQRRTLNGRRSLQAALALCILVGIALAGCRSTPTQLALPGGTYRNDTFHFSVNYPVGWQVNVTPTTEASKGIPLHIIITHTSTVQTTNALISNWSLLVLNTSDSNIAAEIKPLKDRIQRHDANLHAMTLGGQPGYQEQPLQQQIPGTEASDTHTNYYLLLDDYVYEISTDAISSDHADAALQAMVTSFTITK